MCSLGKEDHWIWSYSGEDISDSSWGPNCPNTDPTNTDDCALMVVQSSTTFWWQDASCLTTTVQNRAVAPICQRERTEASTTSTTQPPPPTTTASACKSGWQEFQGHCYYFSGNEHANWQTAEHDCVSRGGHLASVHSGSEWDFIHARTSQFTWLGGTDLYSEVMVLNGIVKTLLETEGSETTVDGESNAPHNRWF